MAQLSWSDTLQFSHPLWPSYFLGLLQPTCTAFVNKGVRNDPLVDPRTKVVELALALPILLL